jgi:hypothetical protein
MTCRHCGEEIDPNDRTHEMFCDGRQGAREAREPDLPLLISGLSEATRGTSTAAAATNDESEREIQREQVYAAIRAAGAYGQTDDELQAHLGLNGSSQRPRRVELLRMGRIDQQRTPENVVVKRQTRMGRSAVVWIAVTRA